MFGSQRSYRVRASLGAGLFAASVVLSLPFEAWSADRPATPASAVTLLGRPVTKPADAAAEAHRLATAYLDGTVRIVAGEEHLEGTRRELGVSVDEATLARWLTEAFDASSDFSKARRELGFRGEVPLIMPTTVDPDALVQGVVALADRVLRSPRDARMNLDTGLLEPDEKGQRLDVDATLDAFRAGLDQGTSVIRAAVLDVPAHRTAAMLRGASLTAVLGEFETRYNPSVAVADRTHNLRVAASRIDGYVLLPGETFDFNHVVGERSEANGFRAAPVIEAGEIDLGIGGGTCQISGTLHAAVFFAGLPILQRNPHSRPSSYIKLGLDAMVSYPDKNFVFRNDLPHPVVLRLRVRDGIVRAELRGPDRHRMVSFVRRVDAFTAYTERNDDDPNLPAGVRVLAQRGMPGFRLTRFRVVRDVGTQAAVRERVRDQYPPTTQIWRVGTGPAAAPDYVPPAGDGHPEYRADEVLELTQGPGIEGTAEHGVAGRTGLPGWTRVQGMVLAP